jgi:N(2)-fixation sustaining protein CowN
MPDNLQQYLPENTKIDGSETDRYITFKGLDCDENARVVMDCIDKQLASPGHSNEFWDYFNKKRAGNSVSKPDDLFLIHSNINQVRELFETWNDEESMELLIKLEEECC